MEEWAKALVSQGGFAVLAAFMGFLGYRIYLQAQGLLVRVLDLMTAASAAQAHLTASIEALRVEVEGLRRGMHSIRDLLAQHQIRLDLIDDAPTVKAPRRPHQ